MFRDYTIVLWLLKLGSLLNLYFLVNTRPLGSGGAGAYIVLPAQIVRPEAGTNAPPAVPQKRTAILESQRNFISASVVSLGRSSKTQCPVSLSTTTVTSEATSFVCCPRGSPRLFSPPITSTGMVSWC